MTSGDPNDKRRASGSSAQSLADAGPGSGFLNGPPVLDAIPAQDAHPDRMCTFTAHAVDPDGDMPIYSLVGTPPAGAFMDAMGNFSWTPTWAQLGTHVISVRASDMGGLFDTKNVTVTVANQAPVMDPLPAVPPGHPGRTINFTATASDPDNDSYIFSLVGAPVGATIDGFGNFTWTPTWAQVGTFSFSVRVTDPGGLSATRSITITVANQAPVIDPILNPGPQHPDQPVMFSVTVTEPDGDPYTFTLINPPAGAAIDDQGNFSWTPTWAQLGAATITVRVTDAGGLSATRTVTINVTNQAPLLDPLPAVPPGHPDRMITFTATGSDPDGDIPTFSLTTGPAGANLDAGGNFLWTPTWAQLGAFPITVRLTDPGGAFATRSMNLTVANQAPTLNPIPDQTVFVNMPVMFAVGSNEPDLDPVTFALINNPPAGAAIDAGGNFSWTPTTAGAYIITVRVTDPGGAYAQRTCTITVNDMP